MGRTERILAGPCNATLLIPSDATVSKRNICFLASTGLDFRGLTPRDRTNTDRGNDSASRQTRPGRENEDAREETESAEDSVVFDCCGRRVLAGPQCCA